jgi:hypothetical protein
MARDVVIKTPKQREQAVSDTISKCTLGMPEWKTYDIRAQFTTVKTYLEQGRYEKGRYEVKNLLAEARKLFGPANSSCYQELYRNTALWLESYSNTPALTNKIQRKIKSFLLDEKAASNEYAELVELLRQVPAGNKYVPMIEAVKNDEKRHHTLLAGIQQELAEG